MTVQEAKWDTQNAFDSVRREGIKEGVRAGIKEGIREGINEAKADVVRNLLLNTDFSIEKIAKLALVSLDFVQQVRAALQNK